MKQFSKDLGNVSLVPKGRWSKEQEYERLNLVYNACDNLSYVAKINVPSGVDIENREYWQPMNVTGYADNNFINLAAENENGTITAYENIEEAIATIVPVNRRAGATLSFYNLNSDRLDRQAEFELWQFNSTDLANWENKDYWNNIYYNWNVFVGWYIGDDTLKNHVKIPNVGQYAYVGSNLNDAILYQCRTNGTWTNTGIKVRNYISVVVSGNITIGENGNWYSDGEDTGIPATPIVDEQLDNISLQLQQHATEIDKLQKQDVVLKSNIDSNFETINNKIDEIKTATDNKIDAADANLQEQITNLADDEDLTSVDDGTGSNVLKFADRTYNTVNFIGKGYKILRKNIIDGKNILTQDMINETNTVYEIRYDFDLGGEEIKVLDGCLLRFNGGSLNNGLVEGTYTKITADVYYIFRDVELKGNWLFDKIYPEWLGGKGDGVLDNTNILQNCINLIDTNYGGKILLSQGVYICNSITLKVKTSIEGLGKGVSIIKKISEDTNSIINIPTESFGLNIKHLTIVGNNISDGININRPNVNGEHREYMDKQINSEDISDFPAYFNGTIDDVKVSNCMYAIYLKNKTFNLYINNCLFSDSVYGVYLNLTDSTFVNSYVANNKKNGLILSCSNCKIANIKVIFNNLKLNKDDDTLYAVQILGTRNCILNIETQDNYCGGFYVSGTANLIANCISNTDGYGLNKLYDESVNPIGFYIANKNNYIVNCEVTSYNGTHGTIMKSPVKIDNSLYDYDDFDIKVSLLPFSKQWFRLGAIREDNFILPNKHIELVNNYSVRKITDEYIPEYEKGDFKIFGPNIYVNLTNYSNNNITILNTIILNKNTISSKLLTINELDIQAILVYSSKDNKYRIEIDKISDSSRLFTIYPLVQNNIVNIGDEIKTAINIKYIGNGKYSIVVMVYYIPSNSNSIYDDNGLLLSTISYDEKIFIYEHTYVNYNIIGLDNLNNNADHNNSYEFAIIDGTINNSLFYPNLYINKLYRKCIVYLNANLGKTINNNGISTNRPVLSNHNIGFQYFDTTLNKPIWWTKTEWVDANGEIV